MELWFVAACSASIAVKVALAMLSIFCWENTKGWLTFPWGVLFLPKVLFMRSRNIFLTSSAAFVSGFKVNTCLFFVVCSF